MCLLLGEFINAPVLNDVTDDEGLVVSPGGVEISRDLQPSTLIGSRDYLFLDDDVAIEGEIK